MPDLTTQQSNNNNGYFANFNASNNQQSMNFDLLSPAFMEAASFQNTLNAAPSNDSYEHFIVILLKFTIFISFYPSKQDRSMNRFSNRIRLNSNNRTSNSLITQALMDQIIIIVQMVLTCSLSYSKHKGMLIITTTAI